MGLCTQRSSNYPLGLCFLKGNELGTAFPLERRTGAIASRFPPCRENPAAPAARPRLREGRRERGLRACSRGLASASLGVPPA